MPPLSSQPKLFRFDGHPAAAGNRYVPVLLIKRGERQALERISADARGGITPWLRVVPPELARTDGVPEPPGEIRRFARATGDHPVYLDVAGTPRRRRSAPRLGLAHVASVYDWALEVDLPFMPVYLFGRPDLASVIGAYRSPMLGAAVLVRQAATSSYGVRTLQAELRAEVIALGIEPSQLDVLVDFGLIHPGASDPKTAIELVRRVAGAAYWRSLIISGSSVPDSFAGEVADDTVGWIERRERELFQALATATGMTPRYSDYGVQHEIPPRPGFAGRMRANVRYTAGAATYVSRGRDVPRDDWPDEYRSVAQRLIDEVPFAGPDCCWADRFVLSLADGSHQARSQYLMMAAGMTHHLEVVSREQAPRLGHVPARRSVSTEVPRSTAVLAGPLPFTP